jgi:glycosyltransferase involved in cell wall biosynthesis
VKRLSGSSFALLAHGNPEGPPGYGVRDFLVRRGARVVMVNHPLNPEDPPEHTIALYEGGHARRRKVRLPSRPPYSYPLDLLVPPLLPAVDGWVGFNNLVTAKGIAARAAGRAGTVVYWAVDFVPDRFGAGTPMTRAYDALDAYVCRAADHRVDLSPPALEGRAERHALGPGDGAPGHVVPIGVWLDRIPQIPEDAIERRRILFLGHLVPRMGVALFLDALGVLRKRGVPFDAAIAGRGPEEEPLRSQAQRLGIADAVEFTGFLSDNAAVEAFLAGGTVAVAPYAITEDSFTRFADPSKLKSYLAAGLPIALTDVPHNAAELQREAGAEVVDYTPKALADALERMLADSAQWRERRAAALRYARGFDWDALLTDAFSRFGFLPS